MESSVAHSHSLVIVAARVVMAFSTRTDGSELLIPPSRAGHVCLIEKIGYTPR